ncbi:uncharacterized protein LOC143298800 isoform X2 [Babylonia areolata]|uniref:uncharacterized protein LOC143298800 isoform X2 n=1 Tax=Babylonia areolata TaxID=304850 RepID=UPI003FD0C62C
MHTRLIVCLGLMTLILMTLAMTSESKRLRGQQKDKVTSRDSFSVRRRARKDDDVVKGEGTLSGADGSSASAAAVDGSGRQPKDPDCADCVLEPAVSIKTSRSRGSRSRRHRSRHRGRQGSRGRRGRSGQRRRRGRKGGVGREASPGAGRAREQPSKRRDDGSEEAAGSSGTSTEGESVSRSSQSPRKQPPSRHSQSEHQRSSQLSGGDEGVDDSTDSKRHSGHAVSDWDTPSPSPSPESRPQAEITPKKAAKKGGKGKRKSKRGKSPTKKTAKKTTKDKPETSSLWSLFSFWSSDDSAEPVASEETSVKVKHDKESEDAQQQPEENVDQKTKRPKGKRPRDRKRSGFRQRSRDVQGDERRRYYHTGRQRARAPLPRPQHQDAGFFRRREEERRNREHSGRNRLNRRRLTLEMNRKRQEEIRRGRERQAAAIRDREREEAARRDRKRQDELRLHRERQAALRREREREEEARREQERQDELRRQREWDILRQERERQMALKREKERQENAKRERERQIALRHEETARRQRERQENLRRLRGRGNGRGRDRGRGPAPYTHRGHYSGPSRYSFPSRPAAADRLESRLSPGIRSHSHALLRSMQHVLEALSGGVRAVKNGNDFVFNGTRYTIMMGVRKQLQEIAKANDMVYDTILRATLLTKDIYMRAHQHRMTGPTTRSLDRPEVSLPSLYDSIRAAYSEERKAQQLVRTAHDLKRRGQSADARLQQVRERFQDNFARNDLRTLVYHVNSTAQKLGRELTTSTQAAYLKRNMRMLSSARTNLTVARDLIYKASDMLATGMADYRGNYRVAQDWRRVRSDQRGVGPPVSYRHRGRPADFRRRQPIRDRRRERPQPIRDHGAAERARLQAVIDRLRRHAREQERMAQQIERILRPAITHGKRALAREGDAELAAWLSSLLTRVQRDTKKMFSALDSIRVLIGAEEELRWMLTTGGCSEDGDDTEGSGCDMEGSGDLVVLGGGEEDSRPVTGDPTDDEDFVFIDEKESLKKADPTSLLEFGKKLSVYLDGVHLRSHDVLQRGDRLFEKTEKLSERWLEMKNIYNAADRARRLWKQTKEVVHNVTRYADDISRVTARLSERVSRSYDSIKSSSARAVEIADRKLAEVQSQKAGGQRGDEGEEEQPMNDEDVLVEAVEKVEQVRREMGEVRSLRQVAPQSCGRASQQLMKLHANISHLRQQVTTAKALLKAMQLAISKSGGGYLSIPVSEKALAPSSPTSFPQSRSRAPTPTLSLPTTVSMVTTVEVCVRTQDLDGPVLLVKGNGSASFSLSMAGRQMSVTVFDSKGSQQESVTSDVTMKADTWYNVKVTRTGKRVVLRVTSRHGNEPPVDNDVSVPSMTYLQPSPVHVYIGGVAESEPFSVGSDTWRGCLAELRVDGRAVPLFHSSSTGEGPQLCSTQCVSSDGGSSLVFNGAGFLHFPPSVLPMRRRLQSIHFRFRSRQSTAALLHLVNQRQRFLLRVMLTNGALVIDTNTPSESIALRSQTNNYNDGAFHTLKIQYRDSTTYPEIDGQDGAFTIERSRPQDLNRMVDGLMIGGFVTGGFEFEKSKYRPLIGCVQELEVDSKPLSVTQAAMSVGVFSGACDSHSLWRECVQFGEGSTGIDLGMMDRSATVLLLFSWDARGPLLAYSRDGKYEADVDATDEGLQVATEEVDLTISRPSDATDHFILLTVTDDGKSVKYSAWGETVETTYGGFWDTRSDVDGEHHVQFGLPHDTASDRRLFGQIAQAMVGQRLINLANYTLSNNLAACQRALPSLVMPDPPPRITTPPTDDKDTCSRDIRCG